MRSVLAMRELRRTCLWVMLAEAEEEEEEEKEVEALEELDLAMVPLKTKALPPFPNCPTTLTFMAFPSRCARCSHRMRRCPPHMAQEGSNAGKDSFVTQTNVFPSSGCRGMCSIPTGTYSSNAPNDDAVAAAVVVTDVVDVFFC